jgi:2-hydroxy-6-oxonona-2,4-dienedioate hydrolase
LLQWGQLSFLLVVLIAVVATVSIAFLTFKTALTCARDDAGKGSLIANVDSGPVEYAQKGTGIPLLSIHGAGGGFDQGLANAARLVGEGFRIIAPSRFGYLRTPVPRDTSPAAQADVLAKLLVKLDIAKAVVVGVSAGARSAVELALRHSDKVAALILIVPALYSPTSPVSVEAIRGSKIIYWIVNVGADFAWWAAEQVAPSVLVRFAGVRPALVWAATRVERDRIMNIVKSVEPLSLRVPGINVDSNAELRELPLGKIIAPTLIISARDDLFNTLPAAQFAASKIRGAELLVYDEGGHLLVGHEQDVRTAIHILLARSSLLPAI